MKPLEVCHFEMTAGMLHAGLLTGLTVPLTESLA